MKQVILKYDDVQKQVICNYGTEWKILFQGVIFMANVKDYKFLRIIFFLKLFIFLLLFIFIKHVFLLIVLIVGMNLLINFLFALNYNQIVIEDLLKKGYVPTGHESNELLLKKGIYFRIE